MVKSGLRDPDPHGSLLMVGLTALAVAADSISISSLKLHPALGQSLSGKWLPRAEGGFIVVHCANSLELKGQHFPVGLKCQST